MFLIPEVDFDALYEKLSKRAFQSLSNDEWCYMVLSILDESYETNFLGECDEIDFDSVFKLDQEKYKDAEERIRIFADLTFGPFERKMLCTAVTKIANDAGNFSDSFSDQEDMALLTKLLTLSCHWSYLIDGDLAHTLALNRQLGPEIRQLALWNLVDRDFRSTLPEHMWLRLVDEVELCQILAIPLLEFYSNNRNPWPALEILSKLKLSAQELDAHEFMPAVVSTFEACAARDGYREDFRAICRKFSPSMVHWLTSHFGSKEATKMYLTYLPQMAGGCA